MNRNSLKTPTGRRQTSWLFTKRAGVEFGATEDKSIQWQGGGLEPGTSGLQVQCPNDDDDNDNDNDVWSCAEILPK